MSTRPGDYGPDRPEWISDQFDEMRWGRRVNTTPGGRDDYADRAGLPRLPQSTDGRELLDSAFAAAKRWRSPREASEFDPARSGVPPPGFRATMAPVSDPLVTVTRGPHPRRPAVDWTPD